MGFMPMKGRMGFMRIDTNIDSCQTNYGTYDGMRSCSVVCTVHPFFPGPGHFWTSGTDEDEEGRRV